VGKGENRSLSSWGWLFRKRECGLGLFRHLVGARAEDGLRLGDARGELRGVFFVDGRLMATDGVVNNSVSSATYSPAL